MPSNTVIKCVITSIELTHTLFSSRSREIFMIFWFFDRNLKFHHLLTFICQNKMSQNFVRYSVPITCHMDGLKNTHTHTSWSAAKLRSESMPRLEQRRDCGIDALLIWCYGKRLGGDLVAKFKERERKKSELYGQNRQGYGMAMIAGSSIEPVEIITTDEKSPTFKDFSEGKKIIISISNILANNLMN